MDNYDEYMQIQEAIRNHLNGSDDKNSPLEQEFIEWPKIQLTLAAEAFLFQLEETPQKDKIKKLSLAEKYSKIVDHLVKNGYEKTVVNVLHNKGYTITKPGKTEEACRIE